MPYTALLGLALVASAIAMALKARLLYQFLQWRRKSMGDDADHSEPAGEVRAAIWKAKRQLEEKQFDYRFRTLGTYSYILLAACEDLPMCGTARAISAPLLLRFWSSFCTARCVPAGAR